MNFKIINFFLLWLFLLVFCVNAQESENWSVILNKFLKNCMELSNNFNNKNQGFIENIRSCLQKRVSIVINTFFSKKVIPILNGVDLIKFKDMDNFTSDVKREKNQTYKFARSNDKTWQGLILHRLTTLFKTHVLKFDVEKLINGYNSARRSGEALENNFNENEIVEGRRRHRRRRNQLMPMMMMGLLIMGSVLIPMGFQFLAVLGGKALIIAKLALMLSSIQGLKKIATNGVNYGLYHAGPVADGWNDRSHQETITHYGVPYSSYQ